MTKCKTCSKSYCDCEWHKRIEELDCKNATKRYGSECEGDGKCDSLWTYEENKRYCTIIKYICCKCSGKDKKKWCKHCLTNIKNQ